MNQKEQIIREALESVQEYFEDPAFCEEWANLHPEWRRPTAGLFVADRKAIDKALSALTSPQLEASDREMGRWQKAIYDLVCKLSNSDRIDGKSCDSGDPLDFTLLEIEQGFSIAEETIRADERRKAADRAVLEYISSEGTDGYLGEEDEAYNRGVRDAIAAILSETTP